MTIDVPGRAGDLARLEAAYARIARPGAAGQALDVAGAPGGGRTALLRAFADGLAQLDEPPTLLAGAFENGRFVSWDDSGPPKRTACASPRRPTGLRRCARIVPRRSTSPACMRSSSASTTERDTP